MNEPAILSPRQIIRLVLSLLLVAGITIGFVRSPGTADVLWDVQWIKDLDPFGPRAGYGHIGQNFPPLSIFMMWLSLRIGDAFGIAQLVSFKAPLALFGILAYVIVLVRERSPAAALLLFLLVSPFGLLHGYYDVVYLPFLLLALYGADRERWGFAGAALAVAGLIKWQPVILAPIFVIGALRAMKGPRQTAMAVLPALVVVVAVVGAFGPAAVFAAFRMAVWDPYLSGQGMNAGWIVSYLLEVLHVGALRLQPDGAVAILTRSADIPAIGATMTALRALFYLFYAASIGVYAMGRPTRQAFVMTALTAAMAQFTWNTGVHENHLFVPMVVAFVAWNTKVLDGFVFLAIAALAVVDVLIFYGFGAGMGFSRIFGIDATVVLAAAELVLFALLCDRQIRACLGRPDHQPQAEPEPVS